jgi:hypothetical protein
MFSGRYKYISEGGKDSGNNTPDRRINVELLVINAQGAV